MAGAGAHAVVLGALSGHTLVEVSVNDFNGSEVDQV